LQKKQKNNPKTKAFAAASKLNMPGEEKTKVFANLSKLKRFAGPIGAVLGALSSDPANADEIDMTKEDFENLRENKARGGLIKGKPKLAKKGWK
jgi:hypothetical protein